MGRESGSDDLVRLGQVLGAQVTDRDGREVGRLADLYAEMTDDYPRVTGLLLRLGRDRFTRVEWGAVLDLAPGSAVVDRVPPPDGATGSLELRLGRDVLDVRVVDIDSHRIGRVGDVDLVRSNSDLRVVAVDIGFGSALRRLGFGLGRLAARSEPDSLDWKAIHLTGGSGREVQLRSPAAAAHRIDPTELAALLGLIPVPSGAEILASIDRARATETLSSTHPELAADLLETLPLDSAAGLLASLEPGTAGRVLREVAPSRRAELLGQLSSEVEAQLKQSASAAAGPAKPARRRWWRIHRGHGRPAQ